MCGTLGQQFRHALGPFFDRLSLYITHSTSFHVDDATLSINWVLGYSWSCNLGFHADRETERASITKRG